MYKTEQNNQYSFLIVLLLFQDKNKLKLKKVLNKVKTILLTEQKI